MYVNIDSSRQLIMIILKEIVKINEFRFTEKNSISTRRIIYLGSGIRQATKDDHNSRNKPYAAHFTPQFGKICV